MNVICPYCQKVAQYLDSEIIYGRSYGMIYICFDCGAYVGVHKGTNKPKGTLANFDLREERKKAHIAFDWYWKHGGLVRFQAYVRLARILHIKVDDCHIGLFNEETCEKVILACEYDLLAEKSVKPCAK